LRLAFSAIFASPLTVVEAPMGYGKTEAVKGVLASSQAQEAWATALAGSPESFWPGFCRELSRVAPESGEAVSRLQAIGLPRDPAQIAATVEIMAGLSFPAPTVLVFDDCHLLPQSFVGVCEGLATCPGFGAQIVAISRNSWGGGNSLPISRPLVSRVDRSLFALTPGEIAQYFALCGVSLGREAALRLHEATEGWISALYLCLVWYRQNGDFSSMPKDIAARMREMVFDPLSPQAKEMLLALTPLERFSAAQAARLHGPGAQALLDELTGKNAFVTFNQAARLYTPHAAFRQLLLDMFEEDGVVSPERRREIHRACGEELLAAGELASAMEAWYKAGDFERALSVLESDLGRNLVTERAWLYNAMFKDCPEPVLERHLPACFKFALASFSAGDFKTFGAQLQRIGRQCALMPPGPEAARFRGELHVLQSLSEFNDIEAMGAHHREALALLDGPTGLYVSDSTWALGSPSVLLMFHRRSGALGEEIGQMRRHMPDYYRLASFHGAGAEQLMEAEALYLAGEPAKAAELVRAALEAAGRHNQLGNIVCALFLQARLALLDGDFEALFGPGGAPGLMGEMRSLIAGSRDGFMLLTADLCEGWLQAALGLLDRIPPWLRSGLGQDSRLYTFARCFHPIVRGRAQLLAGSHAAVIEDLGALLEGGAFSRHLLFSIYAKIFLAAAFKKAGRLREALASLMEALDWALPDNLLLPFAENGDLLGPLLDTALARGGHEEAQPRLADLAGRVQAGREAILKEIRAGESIQRLTDRESETLRLIAAGFSTADTAARMGVTVHTVRAHLKSASQKTGAKGRLALIKLFSIYGARSLRPSR
jgi:LuxR family maltose regulon positive regulatory protein